MLKLFFAGTATIPVLPVYGYVNLYSSKSAVVIIFVFGLIKDEMRMKVVKLGGAQELLHILGAAQELKSFFTEREKTMREIVSCGR